MPRLLGRERSIIEVDQSSICEQSGEQHIKSGALVLVASTNPQFTADPFDKRPGSANFIMFKI